MGAGFFSTAMASFQDCDDRVVGLDTVTLGRDMNALLSV